MERNLCFIVMGFGKKKDPDTNRTIDLDATYKKIIRPAVESAGCKCIRADEIVESGIIDRSMYALLYYADIVIADISTFNPNAIYELGVRHALRPYSTIIIKEDEGKIPFDIGHDRIISYKHLGNEISEAEEVEEDGKVFFVCDIVSEINLNADLITAQQKELLPLIEKAGAEYEGWGTYFEDPNGEDDEYGDDGEFFEDQDEDFDFDEEEIVRH